MDHLCGRLLMRPDAGFPVAYEPRVGVDTNEKVAVCQDRLYRCDSHGINLASVNLPDRLLDNRLLGP